MHHLLIRRFGASWRGRERIMEWYWWVMFLVFVGILLAADLGLFQRQAHEVKVPEALKSTALRVALAFLFCLGLYLGWIGGYQTHVLQAKAGLEFLTGYLVEVALSIDNVFIFALLFKYFKVPGEYQHRILFWGILGALVMRAAMIFAGIALLNALHWIIYIFAIILIYGGIKMIRDDKSDMDPAQNPILKLVQRFIPVTSGFRGGHFFVRENGRLMATPLFMILLAIETTDLVFAVDSIPAVLAVTRDPFIVFTSNVFAIIGLRALYFALAGILKVFRYLHYGLSGILVFIGVKMILSATSYAIGTVQSLAVVIGMLTVSIIASVWVKKPAEKMESERR